MKIKGDICMNNELEQKYDNKDCSAVVYQDVNVCVPVTIKAFAEAGDVEIECLGGPVINSKYNKCPDKSNSTCKFVISQNSRVAVPVIFDAKAETGEASVECECAKEEDNWCCRETRTCK